MGKLVEGYGIGVVLPSADIKGLFKVSDHGAAIYLLPVSDLQNKGWPEYPLKLTIRFRSGQFSIGAHGTKRHQMSSNCVTLGVQISW